MLLGIYPMGLFIYLLSSMYTVIHYHIVFSKKKQDLLIKNK